MDNNKEMELMRALTESVANYADGSMTETMKVRTDYQIATLVSELKDTIEHGNTLIPTEHYLKINTLPPAGLIH